ncbi:MAG TPA: VWA domain-containing protein [Flavisolibacter sp.]
MLQIQFQYPQALWLLTALPIFVLLYIGYRMWRRRSIKALGNPKLVQSLVSTHNPVKGTIKAVLLFLAFGAGCIAVANPRIPEAGGDEVRKGVDIVIALDVSNSMLAADAGGSMRLNAAKAFIRSLVLSMPENRFSLVVFAGQAYVQMPLTYDHTAANLFVAVASPALITAQGTGIKEALDKSEAVFSATLDRYKSIILITDGETHDEGAVQSATDLAANGVMIHTVGIGSAQGAVLLDSTGQPRSDPSGNPILSRLNEPLLMSIATAAKGVYINLGSEGDAVAALGKEFATVEKKALVDTALLNYKTYYHWAALPMLLLLCTEVFFPDRRKTKR